MAKKKKKRAASRRAEFLDSLTDEQRPVVQKLLSTVALQAETIDDLLWKVSLSADFAAARRRILSGASLTKLASKLQDVDVSGPTLEEVEKSIGEMQDAVNSARDAQEVFKAILGFAMKIAPLAL